MTVAPRDAVMDALALVTAHLQGDGAAAAIVLGHCDAEWTARVLADMLAGTLVGAAGGPAPGEAAPEAVLAGLAALREQWGAQYDRQSSGGD